MFDKPRLQKVVGFVGCGKSETSDRGEEFTIYVLVDYHGPKLAMS